MTAADTAGSVLIEVEKDSTLIKAAEAFFKPQPNPAEIRLIMADYKRFDSSGIEVDLDFAALPIGFGSRMLADLATRKDGRTLADLRTFLAGLFKPDSSPNFLIRGFVKTAETLDRLAKDKADSVLIFHSDASIVGMLAPPDPTCGTSLAVGDTETVRKKLHARTLADFGLDGSNVALAIVDSGIYLPRITQLLGDMKPSGFQPKIDKANSWKQHVVTEPFGHRLGHGTMCAYDALIAAPNATLLDYAILLGRPSDESRLKTTLAAAALAYGRSSTCCFLGRGPTTRSSSATAGAPSTRARTPIRRGA
jgi:hypothetical protein